MKATEQTLHQIERAIKKVADKFPPTDEAMLLTDIHLRVNQETGEFVAFDDDDNEITRSVIEQWIGDTSNIFHNSIISIIRKCIEKNKDIIRAKAQSCAMFLALDLWNINFVDFRL